MFDNILNQFKACLDLEKSKILSKSEMSLLEENYQGLPFEKLNSYQQNSSLSEQEEQFQELKYKSSAEYQQYSDKDQEEQQKCPQKLCKICYTSQDQTYFTVTGCQHSFHFDCMAEYLNINIMDSNFPLKCPQHGCQNKLKDQDVKDVVIDSIYQKYVNFQVKDFINKNSKLIFCCMTPNCQYWRFKQCIQQNHFHCQFCGEEYCSQHEVQWHKGQTCKEYDITHKFTKHDRLFNTAVQNMKLKRCPHCGLWIQKNLGCDFIDCKCGGHFCYLCDGTHTSHKCPKEIKIKKQLALEQANKAKFKTFKARIYIPPKFNKPLQLGRKAQINTVTTKKRIEQGINTKPQLPTLMTTVPKKNFNQLNK